MMMVMVICGVVGVLLGGFMVVWVVKEECEEQSEPQRRLEVAVLVCVRSGKRSIVGCGGSKLSSGG